MQNIILKDLKEYLSEERYRHTLSVRDEALKLGKVYKCDLKKLEIATLLHDIGKSKKVDKLLPLSNDFSIMIKERLKYENNIFHSIASAFIAKEKYNIEDEDIINAILYHTTGRSNMSLIEKIVYLADYIEPNRKHQGVEKARSLAYKNLDEAILYALNKTIIYLIEKNEIIDTKAIEARNCLINNI